MQKATTQSEGRLVGMKVGPTGRLALCSQNAHDQNVLIWDKARLGALEVWVGENVARSRPNLPAAPG